MFQIVSDTIDVASLRENCKNKAAGAYVEFEGRVRNHHMGQDVLALEYDVYEQMALLEGEKIITNAKGLFDVLDIQCVHRKGFLNLEETAVWVGVLAKHRDAAFKACRSVIDQIKLRLPIWKKEHYVNQDKKWVYCLDHVSEGSFDEKKYYSRQAVLHDYNFSVLNELKNKRVMIVGLGGLGCPVSMNLISMGIQKLILCDGDHVELSNLHRQHLFTFKDLGRKKTIVAKERLLEMNPCAQIQTQEQYLDETNISQMAQQVDLILDCTDRMDSKYLINDYCLEKKIPWISASIYQQEGQLNTFVPNASPCFRCLWPDAQDVTSCMQSGVLPSAVNALGALQAGEAIAFLTRGESVSTLNTVLLWFSNLDIVKIKRHVNCLRCKGSKVETKTQHHEVSFSDVLNQMGEEVVFIDIRQAHEKIESPFEHAKLLSGDYSMIEKLKSLSKDLSYVLVCQRGLRSKMATQAMREEGFLSVYSLRHGVQSIPRPTVHAT